MIQYAPKNLKDSNPLYRKVTIGNTCFYILILRILEVQTL